MKSIVCVLSFCAGWPTLVQATDADTLATKAQTVLKTHCSRCHTTDGKAKGGFDFVLDRTKLVARGKIVAGQPDESELYQRVRDDAMPPKGVQPRIDADDRALLKQWIEAGAPTDAESVHSFLSEDAAAQLILDDLKALEHTERRFARYFTLFNLSNAGVEADTLQTARHGLAKLLNSLSWHPRIARPVAVNAEQTIYRIDLRSYKWTARTWERLAPVYPYRIAVESGASKALTAATGAELPYVRADWFIATASRPPLYHDFLQLPERDKAIERQLGVDVADDLRENNLARAGFNGSGVSKNNRVIERHDANWGAYWRTYDFSDNTDRQNIFEHPLGPTPGQNGFLHAGGEIIFHLPNGLQAYLLVDADGRRLDKASSEIVSDPKRPDRQVENGISCMTCHVRGLLPKADQVRVHVAKNATAFAGEEVQKIRALYPPDAKLRALMKDDTDRFVQALTRVGVPADEPEPVSMVTQRYEGTLDLVTASAEIGLTAEEFSVRLRKSPALARSLGPLLVKGGTVQRSAFQGIFEDAAKSLRPKPVDLTANVLQPFTGHSDTVLSIAFAADGSKAVSGSLDKTVRLWNVANGKELRTFEGHSDAVTSVAFTPEGRVLSGGRDRTVRLWDPVACKELGKFTGHTDTVRCVVCSPDGKRVLSGSMDGTLRLWDIQTFKEAYTFPRQEGGVYCAAFAPDGKRFAFAGHDGGIRLWDAEDGKELKLLKGHTREVYTLVFSRDGKRLLSGGSDHTARMWNTDDAKEISCFNAHDGAVLAAAFARDDDLLSGTSHYQGTDAPLRVWSGATGKERRPIRAGDGEQIFSLVFSADGYFALSAGAEHRLRLWKLDK